MEMSKAVLLFFLFLSLSEAREHVVGGKPDSWKPPSSPSDSLNNWAEKSRFNVGDSLLWEYDGSKDSVLQVNKRDYVTCNTSSPIEMYNDGRTKVTLEQSGPYYFISGAEGHCHKGQKLIVVVLSEKHRHYQYLQGGVSPAPSPSKIEGPAVAPAPASGVGSLRPGVWVALLLLVV